MHCALLSFAFSLLMPTTCFIFSPFIKSLDKHTTICISNFHTLKRLNVSFFGKEWMVEWEIVWIGIVFSFHHYHPLNIYQSPFTIIIFHVQPQPLHTSFPVVFLRCIEERMLHHFACNLHLCNNDVYTCFILC